MYNLKKYNNDKATVCAKGVFATVYNDTAKIVNVVVVSVVLVLGIAAIAKALK